MRNTLLLLLIFTFALFSCNDKKRHNTDSTPTKPDSFVQIDKASNFLNLFKTINPKGLHIYPPSWNKNGELNKTPFEGVIIDVYKYPYTDNNSIFINIQACKDGNSHIYAIGKFEIDNEFIGLIIRQQSQYDESLIQLLLWNKKQNKIAKGIDLADSFGDEGWFFDTESWISEYIPNSTLKIVTRRKDSEFDEAFKNITYKDSLKTNIFTGGKFKITLNELTDTVSFKLKEWK